MWNELDLPIIERARCVFLSSMNTTIAPRQIDSRPFELRTSLVPFRRSGGIGLRTEMDCRESVCGFFLNAFDCRS